MEYERLAGLRTEDYRYPGDDAAYEALKSIPLLDVLVKAYMKLSIQTSELPKIQGDCFPVTPKTSPEVYRIYRKPLDRLDMPKEYPLYAKADFEYNAFAMGVDDQVLELTADRAGAIAAAPPRRASRIRRGCWAWRTSAWTCTSPWTTCGSRTSPSRMAMRA